MPGVLAVAIQIVAPAHRIRYRGKLLERTCRYRHPDPGRNPAWIQGHEALNRPMSNFLDPAANDLFLTLDCSGDREAKSECRYDTQVAQGEDGRQHATLLVVRVFVLTTISAKSSHSG